MAFEDKVVDRWAVDTQTSGTGDATATKAAVADKKHVIMAVGGGGSVAASVIVRKGTTVIDQFRVAAASSEYRVYPPGTLVGDDNQLVEVTVDVGATDSAEAFIAGYTIQ